MSELLTGLNIQWPISQKILSGEKVVETRTYPLPERYIDNKLLIIETPGPKGGFKARIVGEIIFSESFKYKNEDEFYSDQDRHYVSSDSSWKWNEDKPKWGWVIKSVVKFKEPLQAPKKKGIVFTKGISL